MIRQGNGDLHYLINGLDQGVAAKVPTGVWGVIDLYGMTVKVTIVDRDEREEQNLVTRRNTLHLQGLESEGNLLRKIDFDPAREYIVEKQNSKYNNNANNALYRSWRRGST